MIEEEFSIENHLRDMRKRHKLSQEELAHELGISRQSIISLEQGKSLPSLPLVVTLCNFFDASFEELFRFGQEMGEEIDKVFDSTNKIINTAEGRSPFAPLELRRDGQGRKENIMANEMEPWRPFREMISLRDAMDRLFEDSVITPKAGGIGMPKIDIKDKKDAIVVRAELPGMNEEEIDVEVSDGVMTISGEKKEEREEKEEEYYYKESHSGSFSRSFTLPGDVTAEKAEAEMKNGVLSITVPKIAPKKATKVKVLKSKKIENK